MLKAFLFCFHLSTLNSDTIPNFSQPIKQTDFKYITAQFGWRTDPFTKKKTFHEGIDIGVLNPETVVYSTAKGVVSTLDYDTSKGLHIVINHSFGFQTKYYHLGNFFVRKGQQVSASQEIGIVGNTGRSTGIHLHYEIHFNGSPFDPLFLTEGK